MDSSFARSDKKAKDINELFTTCEINSGILFESNKLPYAMKKVAHNRQSNKSLLLRKMAARTTAQFSGEFFYFFPHHLHVLTV